MLTERLGECMIQNKYSVHLNSTIVSMRKSTSHQKDNNNKTIQYHPREPYCVSELFESPLDLTDCADYFHTSEKEGMITVYLI